MRYIAEELEKNPGQELAGLLDRVCMLEQEYGPADPGRRGNQPGNLAQVRRQEIYGCVNRYRGYR